MRDDTPRAFGNILELARAKKDRCIAAMEESIARLKAADGEALLWEFDRSESFVFAPGQASWYSARDAAALIFLLSRADIVRVKLWPTVEQPGAWIMYVERRSSGGVERRVYTSELAEVWK